MEDEGKGLREIIGGPHDYHNFISNKIRGWRFGVMPRDMMYWSPKELKFREEK